MKNWKNQFLEVKEVEAKPGEKIILPAKHGIPIKREKSYARRDKRNRNGTE
jgi:hypothetical protein